jgi:hypothetical protein
MSHAAQNIPQITRFPRGITGFYGAAWNTQYREHQQQNNEPQATGVNKLYISTNLTSVDVL